MPSEISGENTMLNLFDSLLPICKFLTPHEISVLMFTFFSNFFHFVMNASRLIDETPQVIVSTSLNKVNRNNVKTLNILEYYEQEQERHEVLRVQIPLLDEQVRQAFQAESQSATDLIMQVAPPQNEEAQEKKNSLLAKRQELVAQTSQSHEEKSI